MNKKPIVKNKILSGLLKAMIRIAILLIYVCSLFVFGAGYYMYISQKESQKTLVRYIDENMPNEIFCMFVGLIFMSSRPVGRIKKCRRYGQ